MDERTTPEADPAGEATRVVVSFRSPETDPDADDGWWAADSEWLQEGLTEDRYRRYLRRAHAGPVAVGDEWAEFVSCGCASPEDVILRVEEIDGDAVIGPDTSIEVVPRRAVVDAGGETA